MNTAPLVLMRRILDEKYFKKPFPCSCGQQFGSQREFFEGTIPTEKLAVYEPEIGILIPRNHTCRTTLSFDLSPTEMGIEGQGTLVEHINAIAAEKGLEVSKAGEELVRQYSGWIVKQP